MPRYRKKPIEVDAVKVVDALRAAHSEWSALPTWLAAGYERGMVLFLPNSILVSTGHDDDRATAERDDWIIYGVQGELYPCKPDIFDATYEEV